MNRDPFEIEVSCQIWEYRYRYARAGLTQEKTVQDSWRRVADALAAVEGRDRALWGDRFYSILSDFRFLPGGARPRRRGNRL